MKNEIMSVVRKVTTNKKVALFIKGAATAALVLIGVFSYGGNVFASSSDLTDTEDGADLNGVVEPIVALIKSFIKPILAIVGAGGILFCIMLGVKYATAEEPQEREKRKQALKTAIIGYVLIFVLIVALMLSIDPLTDWMYNSTAGH